MTPLLTAFACILGLNALSFALGWFAGRQVEGARRDAQDASFKLSDMLLDQRARLAEGAQDNVVQLALPERLSKQTRKSVQSGCSAADVVVLVPQSEGTGA